MSGVNPRYAAFCLAHGHDTSTETFHRLRLGYPFIRWNARHLTKWREANGIGDRPLTPGEDEAYNAHLFQIAEAEAAPKEAPVEQLALFGGMS